MPLVVGECSSDPAPADNISEGKDEFHVEDISSNYEDVLKSTEEYNDNEDINDAHTDIVPKVSDDKDEALAAPLTPCSNDQDSHESTEEFASAPVTSVLSSFDCTGNMSSSCVSDSNDLSGGTRHAFRNSINHFRSSLTSGEFSFLESLLDQGEETELNKAFSVLTNDSIFYDANIRTPVVENKKDLTNVGPVNSTDDTGEDNDNVDQSNNTNSVLEPIVCSYESVNAIEIVSKDDGGVELQESKDCDNDDEIDDEEESCVIKEGMNPILCSFGSQTRMARVGERRKSHNSLWKAHESGITLTRNGSISSINATHLQRSASFRKQLSLRRLGIHTKQIQPEIYGRPTSKPPCQLPNTETTQTRIRQSIFCRPSIRSIITDSSRSIPSIPPANEVGQESLMDESFNSTSSIGYVVKAYRDSSFSSDVDKSFSSLPALDLAQPIIRPSAGSALASSFRAGKLTRRGSGSSLASFPSLHLARPIRRDSVVSIDSTLASTRTNSIQQESRQDSIGTFPSLHPANPIRQDSISSIETFPSIHPANLIRQDSVASTCTFPSLHPANPIRQDSVASIDTLPSLHPANPIRQDSMSSIGTLPSLHPANHIKQDSISTIGTLPSLHPANPIKQDSISSKGSALLSRPEKYVRQGSGGSVGSAIPPLAPHTRQDSFGSVRGVRRESSKRHSMSHSIPEIISPNHPRRISLPIQKANCNSFGSKSSRHIRSRSPFDSSQTFSAGSMGSSYLEGPIREESSKSSSSEEHSPSYEEEVGIPFSNPSSVNLKTIVSEDDVDFLGSQLSPSNLSMDQDDINQPVWSAPALKNDKSEDEIPVLISEADDGIGLEIANVDNKPVTENMVRIEQIELARKYKSILSCSMASIISSTVGNNEYQDEFSEVDVDIRRTLSDMWVPSEREIDDGKSSELNSCDESFETFDDWKEFHDEYAGYGDGLRGLPFVIIGTSGNDTSAQPHVLSPPLMESLSCFLPYSMVEHNWWMKYSLIRDGDSLRNLMQLIRASWRTLIAIETMDGEVFGSFTSMPWRKNSNFFGSGESFLWKLRESRNTVCKSAIDLAALESEIEVFPWTGENRRIQYFDGERLIIGGGESGENKSEQESGFGLTIEKDLLTGTTNFCSTFDNPTLSTNNKEKFKIFNLEVWTLTPCLNVEEAEKMEFGRLFLDLHLNKE